MKLLLYCTKSKPYLVYGCTNKYTMSYGYDTTYSEEIKNNLEYFNGKIVAECDFEVEEITPSNLVNFEKESCVDRVSMLKYFKPNLIWNNKFEILLHAFGGLTLGYATHIKNLHIFDEPKELSDYSKRIKNDFQVLDKAPQNMMKCVSLFTTQVLDYILISIHPEWLCKILNGEKTIEVRKKVLRGML